MLIDWLTSFRELRTNQFHQIVNDWSFRGLRKIPFDQHVDWLISWWNEKKPFPQHVDWLIYLRKLKGKKNISPACWLIDIPWRIEKNIILPACWLIHILEDWYKYNFTCMLIDWTTLEDLCLGEFIDLRELKDGRTRTLSQGMLGILTCSRHFAEYYQANSHKRGEIEEVLCDCSFNPFPRSSKTMPKTAA